ncbi:MAG TPA: NADH:flavin oxidoreductase/NADH oxidase family protein [Bacteriovoracaceae bacterium]|nr:NADH:flavin oxidoreductase/NADH oxidase family protein [Bacteriovoracaceae bacterium]
MKNFVQNELVLPCGTVLKNRIAKSAMSEALGTPDHRSDHRLERLYGRWCKGGAGLLITGNIMVDKHALGEPANVAFEKNRDYSDLNRWARAGKENGTHIWTQLNHPGKQSPKFLSREPVAPSSIELKPPLNKMFNRPRALSEDEIYKIIEAFALGAKASKEAGFTGVQIHGAHGYLVSQFLSPLHNQREDQWGGSLENRMRFVVLVYKAIREEVGPAFPVSIKLNSADFQRGGFTKEESMDVVETLSKLGMDLIEVSGGTYESPEMTGVTRKGSTMAREAYFLEYCEEIRSRVKTPLMLTGGFRSLTGMNNALASGSCDVIGLARSMAINPDFPKQLLEGKTVESKVKFLTTGYKQLDKLFPLEITWYTHQLQLMGEGKEPDVEMSAGGSILRTICTMGIQGIKRVRS